MASLTTRSENLDVLKTRRLILQNVNGTYPEINTVPIVADGQGTIGFSTMEIDPSGNVMVSGSLTVVGSIISDSSGANTNNIVIANTKPSVSGTYDGINESFLYLEPLNGRVSVGTNYVNGISGEFIPPTYTFEVNGSTILRNGIVVQDPTGAFQVDASGNVVMRGNLLTTGSITGSIDGSNVTGQTNVTALTISGDISGSQVIGDICGGATYIRNGGYVNTYLLLGDISGGRIQGDISGNARSITGTINGSQITGTVQAYSIGVISTAPYGAVAGDSISGDISGGAGYIRDGGRVYARQIVGGAGFDTSDNVTWYKGKIEGPQIITNLNVSARNITAKLDGMSQIINGVPANLLRGDISAGQSFTMDGSRIIDATITGSKLTGTITGAQIAGSQITGSIPAGVVYGDLSNGYIRGSNLYNDISSSLLIGSVTRATVPATQITYTDVSGLNRSVFSSAMDVSSFVTPINLPSGCIYSLFARASDHPANSIFATGYTDNTYNWFFAPTTNSPFDTVTYTLQPSSDHTKIIISPIPVSPLTFTLYYSLVSSVPYLFSNP